MTAFIPFILFSVLFGYLLGSIPFGLVLGKLFGISDIRKIGSGNIGATNALRTGNKTLAALTLACDSSKGLIAVFLVNFLMMSAVVPDYDRFQPDPSWPMQSQLIYIFPTLFAIIAGSSAILGHCFPVWLKFKGGKGVATTLGVLLAAVPLSGLAACGIWLLVAFVFRLSSLAALTALGLAPLITYFIYGPAPAGICAFIAVLVFWRHKDNIRRLVKGEEPKIGSKK